MYVLAECEFTTLRQDVISCLYSKSLQFTQCTVHEVQSSLKKYNAHWTLYQKSVYKIADLICRFHVLLVYGRREWEQVHLKENKCLESGSPQHLFSIRIRISMRIHLEKYQSKHIKHFFNLDHYFIYNTNISRQFIFIPRSRRPLIFYIVNSVRSNI